MQKILPKEFGSRDTEKETVLINWKRLKEIRK